MGRFRFALLFSVSLPALLPGQKCVYLADANAASGPSAFVGFGATSNIDAKWSAQRLLMLIPRSKIGTTRRTIRALGFAPVSSRTRVITEMRITIGQTDQTSLDPLFHKNGSGFTSTVHFQQIEMRTTADRWNRIAVRYPFDPARNLLIHVAVRGAGSTGTGDAGYRQDPNLQVVTATGWNTRQGTVGRGGLKLELCFEGGHLIQLFDDAGCKGSNGKEPRLDLSGSALLGNRFDVGLRDAPGPVGAAVLVWSFRGYLTLGFDLKDAQAPGCALRVALNGVLPVATSAGRATVPFPLPNDPALLRILPLGFQWFAFDPQANGLQLTSSNWGLVQPGS